MVGMAPGVGGCGEHCSLVLLFEQVNNFRKKEEITEEKTLLFIVMVLKQVPWAFKGQWKQRKSSFLDTRAWA